MYHLTIMCSGLELCRMFFAVDVLPRDIFSSYTAGNVLFIVSLLQIKSAVGSESDQVVKITAGKIMVFSLEYGGFL